MEVFKGFNFGGGQEDREEPQEEIKPQGTERKDRGEDEQAPDYSEYDLQELRNLYRRYADYRSRLQQTGNEMAEEDEETFMQLQYAYAKKASQDINTGSSVEIGDMRVILENIIDQGTDSSLAETAFQSHGYRSAKDALINLGLKRARNDDFKVDFEDEDTLKKFWSELSPYLKETVVDVGKGGVVSLTALTIGSLAGGPAGWAVLGGWAGYVAAKAAVRGYFRGTKFQLYQNLNSDAMQELLGQVSAIRNSSEDYLDAHEQGADDPEQLRTVLNNIVEFIHKGSCDQIAKSDTPGGMHVGLTEFKAKEGSAKLYEAIGGTVGSLLGGGIGSFGGSSLVNGLKQAVSLGAFSSAADTAHRVAENIKGSISRGTAARTVHKLFIPIASGITDGSQPQGRQNEWGAGDFVSTDSGSDSGPAFESFNPPTFDLFTSIPSTTTTPSFTEDIRKDTEDIPQIDSFGPKQYEKQINDSNIKHNISGLLASKSSDADERVERISVKGLSSFSEDIEELLNIRSDNRPFTLLRVMPEALKVALDYLNELGGIDAEERAKSLESDQLFSLSADTPLDETQVKAIDRRYQMLINGLTEIKERLDQVSKSNPQSEYSETETYLNQFVSNRLYGFNQETRLTGAIAEDLKKSIIGWDELAQRDGEVILTNDQGLNMAIEERNASIGKGMACRLLIEKAVGQGESLDEIQERIQESTGLKKGEVIVLPSGYDNVWSTYIEELCSYATSNLSDSMASRGAHKVMYKHIF